MNTDKISKTLQQFIEKMQQKRSPRLYFKNNVWGVALAVMAAVVFCLTFAASHYFKVTQVTVVAPLKSPQLAGAGVFIGRNMLLLAPREVQDFFVSRNPHVAEASVTKMYPSELEVVVTTLTPVAQIGATEGFFVVAGNGRILQKIPKASMSLPTITYYQRLNGSLIKVGDTLPYKDIKDTMRFMTLLKNLDLPPQAVDIRGHNMIACTLKEGKTIVFSSEKDISTQEFQLKTIIERLKITGGDFATLDLRFDKPVIKFKN